MLAPKQLMHPGKNESTANPITQGVEKIRIAALTEKHKEVIGKFYLDPDGIRIIQKITGLGYPAITSYALKRLGLKRRGVLKRSPFLHWGKFIVLFRPNTCSPICRKKAELWYLCIPLAFYQIFQFRGFGQAGWLQKQAILIAVTFTVLSTIDSIPCPNR